MEPESRKVAKKVRSGEPFKLKVGLMRKILWPILFAFIDILGFSLILPLLPYFAKEFQMSHTSLGLLLTSNAIAQMISAPIIGVLSDRYGRRPLLLLCIFGTFVSFLILASFHSIEALFISRILDGLLGGNISLAEAYISGLLFNLLRT